MRRRALLLGLALALPGSARAGSGAAGAEFLQLGVGARATAMGEAYSAVSDDADSLYWNPAGLARLPRRALSATFMHAPYAASSYYDYLAFAQNLGAFGTVGASLQYFTIGPVTQTDAAGTETGTLTPYDLAVSLAYAREISGFSVGLAGKHISSKIASSARADALDLGVVSPAYFQDRLRLALVAQNLGTKLRYDQVGERLPRTFKAGAAWRFAAGWTAAFDLGLPADDSLYGALGAERTWTVGDGLTLAGRAGFNTRALSGLDGVRALALGAGFSGRRTSLDYAFVPMGSLGSTHRVSLSYRFDAAAAPQPDLSQIEASVEYSTATSLPPPSRLHCEEYQGVTVCMDADQRQRMKIRYEPPSQNPKPAGSEPAPLPVPGPEKPPAR